MASPKKSLAISQKTRQRIENDLRNWGKPNSDARKRFEAAQGKLDTAFRPLEDAIAGSERLTQDDLAIRINTRD